jgi:5-methylcytosine-specific restriction protein A
VANFNSIFELLPTDAIELIHELKSDAECKGHFKRSHNVQESAFNKYLEFLSSVTGKNSGKEERLHTEEGEAYACHTKEYNRNKELRDKVALKRGYRCEICGMNFEEIYGSIGKGFIEVHHIRPLADGVRNTDEDDLICVCSNCHSMLHRTTPVMAPKELHKLYASENK